MILAAGVGSALRLPVWANERTLFGAAVERSPESYLAHLNYASTLASTATARDRLQALEKARVHFLEAARLAPGNFRIHYDLGNLYRQLGRDQEARQAYERALALEPSLTQAQRS